MNASRTEVLLFTLNRCLDFCRVGGFYQLVPLDISGLGSQCGGSGDSSGLVQDIHGLCNDLFDFNRIHAKTWTAMVIKALTLPQLMMYFSYWQFFLLIIGSFNRILRGLCTL